MVIQRIQSLLLLIAAGLMAVVLTCLPLAGADSAPSLHVYDYTPLLVLGCVAGALQLINIFLFRDLKKQMLVAKVAAFLVFCFAGIGALMMVNSPVVCATAWVWPAVVSVASISLTLWAKSRMKADYDLLRSSDRIR